MPVRYTTLPVAILLTTLLLALPATANDPTPLPRAHAHNDYEHDRPLLDALDNGFCSGEADVWLVDGALLVAHDRKKVDPSRTLVGLYLDPLRDRVQKNGGAVYPNGPEFTLLVDFKSNGEKTYAVLRKTLANYKAMLTTTDASGTTIRAIRVIISGSRPRAMMEAEETHLATYDGRLDDLGSGASSAFIPLISSSWPSTFKWQGRGDMPPEERAELRRIVKQAHDEGRRVRFWAIAHRETLWRELYDADVDLINADKLSMLRDFLLTAE